MTLMMSLATLAILMHSKKLRQEKLHQQKVNNLHQSLPKKGLLQVTPQQLRVPLTTLMMSLVTLAISMRSKKLRREKMLQQKTNNLPQSLLKKGPLRVNPQQLQVLPTKTATNLVTSATSTSLKQLLRLPKLKAKKRMCQHRAKVRQDQCCLYSMKASERCSSMCSQAIPQFLLNLRGNARNFRLISRCVTYCLNQHPPRRKRQQFAPTRANANSA
mmetsp:Transcript_12022/g.26030  ORF Transcript_12022/g.26030 Transcript_12022/m.26030 type:complete len:216 (+) Transcript_12022:33-680(+)